MSGTRGGMRMCWSVHVRALTPHTCVLVAHSLVLPREVALELSQPVVSGVSQSSSPCPLVFGTEPEARQDCSLCACGIWFCPLEWQWKAWAQELWFESQTFWQAPPAM